VFQHKNGVWEITAKRMKEAVTVNVKAGKHVLNESVLKAILPK
jgi:hypothetical protein